MSETLCDLHQQRYIVALFHCYHIFIPDPARGWSVNKCSFSDLHFGIQVCINNIS
jgi:hypothetical protein